MANQIQLNPVQAAPQELSYLENIIDKKIEGVALSCFETIVDWFLTTFSCFYPAYNRLYQDKLAQIQVLQTPDGAAVHDLTAGKIAAVVNDPQLLGRPQEQRVDVGALSFITLNGLEIYNFRNVDYVPKKVTIKDDPAAPGKILINEYAADGTPHPMHIDLNHPFLIKTPKNRREQEMHVPIEIIQQDPRFQHPTFIGATPRVYIASADEEGPVGDNGLPLEVQEIDLGWFTN